MNENQTVLLMDDSENDLTLMRMAFKKADFKNPLQVLRNGEEVIAYLKGEGAYRDRLKFPLPALMLLDLNTPMSNGFDVLTWLRTQTGLQRITVVILSASNRMEDVQRALDLGANSFLVKPTNIDELVATIRSLRDWLQYNHFPPNNDCVKH